MPSSYAARADDRVKRRTQRAAHATVVVLVLLTSAMRREEPITTSMSESSSVPVAFSAHVYIEAGTYITCSPS